MKRVVNKGSSNNFKLTAIIVGVFLLCAILLSVSPAINTTVTGNQVVNNFFNGKDSQPAATSSGGSFTENLFASWNEGNLDISIAKYLFWIILTALIFASLNFAKFPDSTFLQGLLAIPIGFLFTAYITPSELFTVLTAYTAAGLTMAVIIPFVVLLFFSSMLLSNEKISGMTIGKIVLEVALWLLFVGFMIYKLIAGYPGVSLSSGAAIVMFVVLGLSLLILLFNKLFRSWVRGLGIEIRRAKADVEGEARGLERKAGLHEES